MANDSTPGQASKDGRGGVPRREFLKVAGAGAGMLLLGGCGPTDNPEVPGIHHERRLPFIGRSSADVVVIGAGIWGGFTALNLRQQGAKVTLVDAFGPGNGRSTSGDESRGVRSSYGDRASGEHWMLWAREAMKRWKTFDQEWGRDLRLGLFFTTGDLILRASWEPYLVNTKKWWDKHHIPYQQLAPADVRKAFPVISMDDIRVALYEPDAGVVRARRSAQAVAAAFEHMGGKIVIGRAKTPFMPVNGKLSSIELDTGETLRADTFVVCPGPWMGKTFPELFTKNPMRTPLGYVCYYGTPVNDERFTFPHLPSFNFPGVTGWAALPVDNVGFRVRGGERAPTPPNTPAGTAQNTPAATAQNTPPGAASRNGQPNAQPATPPEQLDPDTSDRWADAQHLEGPRRFVAHRFPLLAKAPLLKTHACHYEISPSGNFIVDWHPHISNLLIAGGGNAEGFKFGPVIGDYVAQRALGEVGSATVAKAFKWDAPPDSTRQRNNRPPPTDSAGKRVRATTAS
jgi:glycine/D-amino acid oxidase-like deaminating enzyme